MPPRPFEMAHGKTLLKTPEVSERMTYTKKNNMTIWNHLVRHIKNTRHMKKLLKFPLPDTPTAAVEPTIPSAMLENATIILYPEVTAEGFKVDVKLVGGEDAEMVITLDGERTWKYLDILTAEQISRKAYSVIMGYLLTYGEPFEIFDESIEAACRMIEDDLIIKNHFRATSMELTADEIRWGGSNRLDLFDQVYMDAKPEDILNQDWDAAFSNAKNDTERDCLLREIVKTIEQHKIVDPVELVDEQELKEI